MCGSVVNTTERFRFYSLALLFVLVSLYSFSIVVTSIGEEGAGLYASHAFVSVFCTCLFLSFFSSSWLAAFCDCGTPWSSIYFLTLIIIVS